MCNPLEKLPLTAIKLRLSDDYTAAYVEIRRFKRDGRVCRRYSPYQASMERVTRLAQRLSFRDGWFVVPQTTGWLAIERTGEVNDV